MTLIYQSSIETYPHMKRNGYKQTKAVDYLAWKLQTARTMVSMERMQHANKTRTVTKVIYRSFSIKEETQVNPIATDILS